MNFVSCGFYPQEFGHIFSVCMFTGRPEKTSCVVEGCAATSITDKAEQKPIMVGLTLLIVLRLTLIAGMDPPDMTVLFFGIIPAPPGVATAVPVNFA